jgi:hypothetical protein
MAVQPKQSLNHILPRSALHIELAFLAFQTHRKNKNSQYTLKPEKKALQLARVFSKVTKGLMACGAWGVKFWGDRESVQKV